MKNCKPKIIKAAKYIKNHANYNIKTYKMDLKDKC